MVIEALKAARDFIENDRQVLAESLTVNGEIVFEDDTDRRAMAEYVKVLVVIDGALEQALAAPVQEPTIAACIIGADAVGKKIDGYEAAKVFAAMQKAMGTTPAAQPAPVPLTDDPLQGAVDWFLQADGEYFCTATVQRTLRIGYNRAKRLCDTAKERAAHGITKGQQ
jgi:DNA segregation ATPase FtsK/SpoIIIE-like protein